MKSLAAIRRRLLADPALIDVRAAALRLIAKRDGCSPAAAKNSLVELSDNIAVDRMFRLVLPDEHRRQTGSVAERRYNFFRIIRERFPVDWEYLDSVHMEYEEEEEEEPGRSSFFDYGIVIESMRPGMLFSSWRLKRHWDEVPLAYQLADALFFNTRAREDKDDWDAARKWAHLAKKLGLDGPVKLAAEADRGALLQAFARARGPVKHLPDAYKVLAYDTGSIFLDFDPDEGVEPEEWSREAVEFLTAQADGARRLLKRVEALDKWLEADPAERGRRLLNYYTKHRRNISHENRQRIRLGIGAQPPALVDVL